MLTSTLIISIKTFHLFTKPKNITTKTKNCDIGSSKLTTETMWLFFTVKLPKESPSFPKNISPLPFKIGESISPSISHEKLEDALVVATGCNFAWAVLNYSNP